MTDAPGSLAVPARHCARVGWAGSDERAGRVQVELDVKGVHTDLTTLINAGVIERTDEGVAFNYDQIHFEFDVSAAA